MIQRQPATPGDGYGLGFQLVRHSDGRLYRIQHGGATGTFVWLDYDRDLIGVYFTQTPPTRPNRWRRQLMETIESIFPVVD